MIGKYSTVVENRAQLTIVIRSPSTESSGKSLFLSLLQAANVLPVQALFYYRVVGYLDASQASQTLRGQKIEVILEDRYNFSFFLRELGSLLSNPWGIRRAWSRYALSSSSYILLIILFAAGNLLPNSFTYTAVYKSHV